MLAKVALLLNFSLFTFHFSLASSDLSPVALSRPCDGRKVVIVSDGKARLPIIVADGARERWAAQYLAATIRGITGVKPDLYVETPERPVNVTPALRIAKVRASDAFRVITQDGTVRFLGRSDYAVFDWCERALGVRFYNTPDDVPGKTFPRMPELIVEPMDYADRPVFAHRDGYARQSWARVQKNGGTHQGGVNVHSPHHWFADPEVRTNHPNIFARQPDGSRGEMPLLCYGSPETLAYYKRRIDEHIAGVRDSDGVVDTRRRVITVSQWDVRLECTCEYCQRLFDPSLGVSGSGSPIIWGYFLKELAGWAAATHPDYLVSFLPYLNTCAVPAGLDLTAEGNCEAMLCSMPGLAMFKEPSVREREEKLITDWARVTGRPVLNWHYACWPREFTTAPYLYGRTIAGHYRRMAPYEIGSFINGGPATAAERLSDYVWLKCLWNPNVDVDAIYDVFAERMFGAAAKPMRRLMALQEAGWERHWPWTHVSDSNMFDISYSAEDVAEMKRLLREARERTKGDALSARRVSWYADDFTRFLADETRYWQGADFAPLEIVRADRPPTVDGRFDEPCWAKASARLLGPAFGDGPLKRPTLLRSVWTDDGVYFAIVCKEPTMDKLNRKAAYGELQCQDTLELFLDASGTATGCCHRLMFDVRNRMSATADVEWPADGVRSAVVCSADAWCVEVYVPFAALCGPISRETWRGNVIRWHPGPNDECEWSRLSTRGSDWNQNRDAFSAFHLRQP